MAALVKYSLDKLDITQVLHPVVVNGNQDIPWHKNDRSRMTKLGIKCF